MMRIGAVVGVLALTGFTFLFAYWSLSDDLGNEDQSAAVVDSQEAEALRLQLSDLQAVNAAGQDQIDTLTQTNATLTTQVADLQSALADTEDESGIEQINALTQTNAALTTQVADLQSALADTKDESGTEQINALTQTNAALTTQVADLQSEIANALSNTDEIDATISSLTDEINVAREGKQAVEDQLTVANTEVETLTARIAVLENETLALSQSSTDQTIELSSQVDALNAELEVSKQRVETLTTEADQNADVIAELTAQVESAQAEVATLTSQVAQLSTDLEARTAEARVAAENAAVAIAEAAESAAIAAQATAAPAAEPVAAQDVARVSRPFCSERATAMFVDQKIDFDSDTATLTAAAAAALENFADVAQQCAQSDLALLIGSYTDSRGSSQSNLLLTQSRADAIASFLTERGVPAGAMQAIGYGETDPVASNGTIEGRAQNRRVTLEWQQ